MACRRIARKAGWEFIPGRGAVPPEEAARVRESVDRAVEAVRAMAEVAGPEAARRVLRDLLAPIEPLQAARRGRGRPKTGSVYRQFNFMLDVVDAMAVLDPEATAAEIARYLAGQMPDVPPKAIKRVICVERPNGSLETIERWPLQSERTLIREVQRIVRDFRRDGGPRRALDMLCAEALRSSFEEHLGQRGAELWHKFFLTDEPLTEAEEQTVALLPAASQPLSGGGRVVKRER